MINSSTNHIDSIEHAINSTKKLTKKKKYSMTWVKTKAKHTLHISWTHVSFHPTSRSNLTADRKLMSPCHPSQMRRDTNGQPKGSLRLHFLPFMWSQPSNGAQVPGHACHFAAGYKKHLPPYLMMHRFEDWSRANVAKQDFYKLNHYGKKNTSIIQS
jgi:hypothetical protein